MATHATPFYSTLENHQKGLIGGSDVVIIKVNC